MMGLLLCGGLFDCPSLSGAGSEPCDSRVTNGEEWWVPHRHCHRLRSTVSGMDNRSRFLGHRISALALTNRDGARLIDSPGDITITSHRTVCDE